MAKKQDFVVGSTNPNTNTWTTAELNNGWDKYQVLKSGDLDGVFNAVSDYSNDSSQEIWNAIRILKGSNPTGASTDELGNIISTVLGAKATKATDFITPLTSNNKGATAADLNTLREEIETSSLTFKGYVSTSAPSSSTYGLVAGNIWINASAMPTTFPVAIAGVWNGTSWESTTDTYTVQDFDFFRNINDNEGYYWFGGQWTVMSTDMSTTYFTLNQTSGKWEIKSSVDLSGEPTTTTAATTDNSNKIATTAFVKNVLEGYVPTGGAANTSLSNLVDAGKNISNWSSNVTNCITEIPQDIKLELDNGTLTLKAGSKVYVPNGSGVFDTVTVDSDLTATDSNNTTFVICKAGNALTRMRLDKCFSGSTEPTGFGTTALWYDTANNVIKTTTNSGTTWTGNRSFPVAICTSSGGEITSIDQIFNGFGYVGSTIFALPGVKGLRPNGRNTDGTLKNIEWNCSDVVTRTFSSSDNFSPAVCGFNGSSFSRLSAAAFSYNEQYNIMFDGSTHTSLTILGYITLTSGVINSFSTKTVFHAVDYSDTEYTAPIINILKTLYPVGSLYVAKSSVNTCPLATLGVGTWTLRSENTIVSSVGSSASVAIKGNGKVLGLTNGTNSGSLVSDGNASFNPIMCNSLNVNIGTTATEAGWTDAKTIGVVTDATKSGLTGTASVTSNTISVHIWERTA